VPRPDTLGCRRARQGDSCATTARTRSGRRAARSSGAQDRYAAHAFPDLTAREREVLELLASGARNHEIARRLGMSEKTVRNHVSAVLLKLGVPDRTAAAVKARDAGLGRQ
jgi:DNA-binding NarL/FixJ family response regulator